MHVPGTLTGLPDREERGSTYLQNVSNCFSFNPLNAKLNPIWHLLALLGAHPILHVSRIRVNAV
jgi:hypothetical protein